jgi:endonuclease YncB( thermonuclease family)
MSRSHYIVLMMVFMAAAASPARGNTGVVRKVLRGDLIQIGDSFVARLTGISAPSRNEELGLEIYEFTKRELEGRSVKLFTWTRDNTAAGIVYDGRGYPFVQVFYGESLSTSFNEVLLKKGYARIDLDYLPEELNHYIGLEREARDSRLGIWRSGRQAGVFQIQALESVAMDGSGVMDDPILPGAAIVAHNVSYHRRDMGKFMETIRNDSSFGIRFHEMRAGGYSVKRGGIEGGG